MEKYLATHPQALALKELGFNEPCIAVFSEIGELSPITNLLPCNSNVPSYATAPLKSQVFEWGRKEHQIETTVACYYDNKLDISYEEREYHCYIVRDGVTTKGPKFKTYEEAELACIDKLIEVIKNNLDI